MRLRFKPFPFSLLDLIEKRKMIVNELVEMRESVAPFIDLFDREDVKKLLETDRLLLEMNN